MTQWLPGWGFEYQSPTGNVNDATQVRHNDQVSAVTGTPGNWTYTPVSPSAPPTNTGVADSSARAIIDGALGQYGLQSLSTWAWSKWQAGESIDQIMLELRATPEYKARFPAMDVLSKEGRAITEAQYINYEQSAASIFKAAGLPSGFYDQPDDFAKFLTADIALPELQNRVQMYQTVAFSQPPEVLQAWHDLYGLSGGDLTAFFIDPTRAEPLIQQKYSSAQAAGWANRTGFGSLTQQQAESVGTLGLTDQQIQQGFGDLGTLKPLLGTLQGSGETAITTDQALLAEFGQNAPDQALIAARKAGRLAAFQAGGGVATSQQGAVGAGAAR